jgi:hypothetical protein
MIPIPGDIYLHEDGTQIQIRAVDHHPFRVEFSYGTALCEADEDGWKSFLPKLTLVPRFRLVDHLLPDLKIMQALEKDFVVGFADIPLGILGDRENVTILVARGGLGPWLKQLGIHIHKLIHDEKAKDQNLN